MASSVFDAMACDQDSRFVIGACGLSRKVQTWRGQERHLIPWFVCSRAFQFYSIAGVSPIFVSCSFSTTYCALLDSGAVHPTSEREYYGYVSLDEAPEHRGVGTSLECCARDKR